MLRATGFPASRTLRGRAGNDHFDEAIDAGEDIDRLEPRHHAGNVELALGLGVVRVVRDAHVHVNDDEGKEKHAGYDAYDP